MARKPIDIGVVGNDGTGDSIRDSFRKVNENFLELYSSLGLGDRLTFKGLDDTPSSYDGYENSLLTVGVDQTTGLSGIKFKPLLEGTGVKIDSTPTGITINTLFSAISGDPTPQLGGPLNAGSGTLRFPIGNLPDLRSASEFSSAIARLTQSHGLLYADPDRIVANKGYVDRKIALAGVDAIDPRTNTVNPDFGRMTGPLVLSRDPQPSDDETYDGLVAATKRYVDGSAFGSVSNLYVALSGQDERPGVSPLLQGRALAYAYRTIEAALKRAEEILLDSRIEIGPYKKVLTYNNGNTECTLSSIGIAPDSGSGFQGIAFMSIDTISIADSSLDFNYRAGDVVVLNVGGTGSPAQVEVLAVNAGGEILSFRLATPGVYSVLPGGLIDSTTDSAFGGGAKFDVTYKVNNIRVKNIVDDLVDGRGSGYGLVSVRILPGIGDTTGSGAFGTANVVDGRVESITVTDQGSGFTTTPNVVVTLPRFKLFTSGLRTDFTGNVIDNTSAAARTRDIRDGLYLRGEESGALAQILAHRGELDGLDEVFDVDIKYGSFVLGEVISYGDVTKLTQISVNIESGTYEENYPLRIPQNVAIIGDEFRRVIVKPKVGISSSPWAFLNFKRDLEIDGNIVAEQEFGWHYLADPSKPVYPLVNNKGFYRSAAELLYLNKSFIQEEIVAWIAQQVRVAIPSGTFYNLENYSSSLWKRDVGLIIDAQVFDLRWGGYNRTISAALKYQANGLITSTPSGANFAAINYIDTLAQQVLANTEIPTVYNIFKSQVIDLAYVSEVGSGDVVTDLKDVAIDFINGSGAGAAVPNFPKDNNDLDVFLCNDATIIRAVSCQGHGGFMMVLDPEGQILAKSPYGQECASFSRSTGRRRFSGGMFVDGFTGNLQFEIYDKGITNPGNLVIGNSYTIKTLGNTDFVALGASTNTVGLVFTATGVDLAGTTGTAYNNGFLKVRGLGRFPNLPASFIVNDTVYRINYVRDFVFSTTGSTASFILDETTPWPFPIFEYDSAICSRDVGLILDGVRYDVVLGTNFNQRKSGLVYRENNARVVIDSQLNYTISAVQKAHTLANAEIPGDQYAAARGAVDLSSAAISNILRNGSISAAALTITNPPGLSTNLANAKTLLLANLEYIKDQTIGWINTQVSGNTSPFTTSFVYDSVIYARNVQYTIEATAYNLIYGGNNAVVDAGLKYYDGVGNLITLQIPSGEIATTAAAINYAKYLAKQVIQNLAPAVSYSATTRTSGTGASATEAASIETLITYVTSILSGGVGAAPTITYPILAGGTYTYDSNKVAAVTTIIDNKAAIQAGVIVYVDEIANRYEVLMPGNRSMLANDFTQINDMGYGIVANNGGLLEAVSVFTYYCYISYYSRNGGQIRSIGGSSAHGVYALVSEGADPLEIPTPVTLYQDLATGAAIVSTGIYLNSSGGLTVFINNYDFAPLDNGELEVIHTDGNLYRYSITSVSTADLPTGYARLNIATTGNSTSAGLAFSIPDGTKVTVRALSQLVLTGDIVDVATRPSTALALNETVNVYRVLQFQDYTDPDGKQNCTISNGNPTLITATAHGQLAGYIVIFSSTGTLPTGLTVGIKYYVLDTGLSVNTFRVSLAKNGSPVATTTAGSGTQSFVPGGLARTSLRENYDYVELTPWSPNEYRGATFTVTIPINISTLMTASGPHGFSAGDVVAFSTTGSLPIGVANTKNYFVISSGLSSTQFKVSASPGGDPVDASGTQTGTHTVGKVKGLAGDTSFAIAALSSLDTARVVGMKVVWLGEKYTVTQYDNELVTSESYGRIYFNRGLVDNVLVYQSPPTLKAGVARRVNASSGTLTIRISLTRVTGHDLLEIGTGSYSDTNYPNEIYGAAVNPLDDSNETQERGSGRTFYVTTDQFGNFRVGPYFRVDQGTGKVTFSAAIALSNLDGLGFKRGVPISEFSTDSAMTNNATDTVPTQNATRTYIERRLGISHIGAPIVDTQLIPPLTGGFMSLDGQLVMNGDMDLGDNRIINIADPAQPTDAVNLRSLALENLQEFNLVEAKAAELLVFTGEGNNSENATVIGDINLSLDSTAHTVSSQINSGVISNANINASAAIDHAKLSLDTAYATTASTLAVTASGTGAINFSASISGTTLTVRTSGAEGLLIQAGLTISGGVVPENTYIIANISGVGLNSTWQLNNSVSQATTTLTASLVTLTFASQSVAPFSNGQRIEVTGLSITGYNGTRRVVNSTQTTVTYSGTTTGSATGGAVRALRGPATFDTTQFTVTNGYVTIKDNGLLKEKLQKITGQRVLGNSGSNLTTDNISEVTFATIIDNGLGLKKASYSPNSSSLNANGVFLQRKSGFTGLSDTDYITVEASDGTGSGVSWTATDNGRLVSRSSQGQSSFREITIEGNNLTSSYGGLRIKNSTNGDVAEQAGAGILFLNRTITSTGGSHRVYAWQPSGATTFQGGILIGGKNATGTAADEVTFYDNTTHQFRNRAGTADGNIVASSVQTLTLTAGTPTTVASIIGRWQLSGVGSRMQATYSADLAEYYEGDKEYAVGTVLVFGGDKEVTIATSKEDHRIAGVVSDTAAYSMYGACPGHKNLIALQGRVPVRVVGTIAKGDLLTTSSIAGVAVSVGGNARTGTVIGKALEDYNSDHVGTIQVAVGRT